MDECGNLMKAVGLPIISRSGAAVARQSHTLKVVVFESHLRNHDWVVVLKNLISCSGKKILKGCGWVIVKLPIRFYCRDQIKT